MQREPSIHVTLTAFIEQFYKLNLVEDLSKKEIREMAKKLFSACRPYSLSHRAIQVSNQKLLDKANKVKASSLGSAALLSKSLVLVRRKLKHRGISQINPGDKEWLQIKELTRLATEFSEEFNLPIKTGFIEYLTIALSKMQKFGLNKIAPMNQSIYDEYEAKQIVENDRNRVDTKKAYDYYSLLIAEKTGIHSLGYEHIYEKYACFVKAAVSALEFGVDVKLYIKAQFDGLSFRDAAPDPLQLNGPKALQRLTQYCYSNNINLHKTKKIDWNAVKQK